jgi:hypothetical protein
MEFWRRDTESGRRGVRLHTPDWYLDLCSWTVLYLKDGRDELKALTWPLGAGYRHVSTVLLKGLVGLRVDSCRHWDEKERGRSYRRDRENVESKP